MKRGHFTFRDFISLRFETKPRILFSKSWSRNSSHSDKQGLPSWDYVWFSLRLCQIIKKANKCLVAPFSPKSLRTIYINGDPKTIQLPIPMVAKIQPSTRSTRDRKTRRSPVQPNPVQYINIEYRLLVYWNFKKKKLSTWIRQIFENVDVNIWCAREKHTKIMICIYMYFMYSAML